MTINTCLCGCGEVPKGKGKFLPGHDQRAIHDIIYNHYGSVEDFVLHHQARDIRNINLRGGHL